MIRKQEVSQRQIPVLRHPAIFAAMSIGERLRTLRERAKLGQADIAAVADVSIPTVSEWENNRKKPGRVRLEPLAKLLNVSVDYLLTGEAARMSERTETAEEESLLRLFRASNAEQRKAVITILKAVASENRN